MLPRTHVTIANTLNATTRTRTHLVLGILVGAGIQQQPHAVRATIVSGTNQRRESVRLRIAQMRQNV